MVGLAHLAPTLARWHVAEFGDLYDPAVWGEARALAEFQSMADGATTDRTWLAFRGPGRGADALIGSVSLVATDDLAGYEHLGPWLASLYVAPSARSAGLGRKLTQIAVDAAAAEGRRHVYLFTAGQERYYTERGWHVVARTTAAGHDAAVMARATSARAGRRTVASTWCTDQLTRGAYSYLRIGGRPAHRQRLAQPILANLWFAGEATSVDHPGTLHGAWFSGERAAHQVIDSGASTALVVGAGLAGLAAARALTSAGITVTVVEGHHSPGGRARTDATLGVTVPLGGAWLHGDHGHPLAGLVEHRPDEWQRDATFLAGHGPVSEADRADAAALYHRVLGALEGCPADQPIGGHMERLVAAATELSAAARRTAMVWLRTEIENLMAGDVADFPASGGREPYALEGDNAVITGGLDAAIAALADGLDLRTGHRVSTLTATAEAPSGRGWRTDTGLQAEALIVTASIGVLRAGALHIEPELPADVRRAIDGIGYGKVAKVFATYERAWWPPVPCLSVEAEEFDIAVDATAVTGIPTLCWFSVGSWASQVEGLDEHGRCNLVDEVAERCGLTTWDHSALPAGNLG